jgi:outer membrane protein OmpA-like peptidoglycan-associated protein
MLNKLNVTLLFVLTMALHVPAQAADSFSYWNENQSGAVKTGFGECWRTIHWSADMAMPGCEGGKYKVDTDKDGVIDSKDQCPGTSAGIAVDAKGCAKDSDMDGVADSNDKCPGTGAGISVDASGCVRDSDKDGVADSNDKCPGTPAGTLVYATGCPVDTDNDGIADANDQCPRTPAGTRVDASGCTLNMDEDNDGIMNAMDDCPNTPAGTAVNTRGCKLTAASIKVDNVRFKTGTDVLNNESRQILDNVAQTLKQNPHLSFEIAGHTDSTGNYQANVNLSAKRANSVRQYLMDQGVAGNRLTARGYGPDKPVASNGSREGRAKNRRVELNLK